jgi:hypothetical protein
MKERKWKKQIIRDIIEENYYDSNKKLWLFHNLIHIMHHEKIRTKLRYMLAKEPNKKEFNIHQQM